jgi:NTE family protein
LVKDQVDDARLAQLSKVPLLSTMDPGELAEVAAACEEICLEAGSVVFPAGGPGDALYVVLSGALQAWAGGLEGGLVGEFRSSDVFGEQAVLLDTPRSATVQVTEDCRLLVVGKATVERCLERHAGARAYLDELRRRRRVEALGRNPLCALLGPDVLPELESELEERVYERGDHVFRAGDRGEEMYLVLAGELEVWGGEAASGQLIGHLGPPNSFGELALLLDQPRAGTVRVAERARLLVISREVFERRFRDDPRTREYLDDLRENRDIQLLEQIPLFSYLGAEERRIVRGLLREVSFDQGEVVCRAGEDGDALYIVRSGELEVWGGDRGRELVGTIGPSGFFGEDALVLGVPRSATVKASGPVRLLALEREVFERFFLHNPKAVAYLAEVRHRRRAAAVQQISLFNLVSRDALAEVQSDFVEQTFRKGQTVCRAGDESTTFYIVLGGELEVWSAAEAPVRLARLGPGDFFGELAVILGEKRAATVIAAQRTQLLGLPKEAFTRLFLRDPRSLEYFSRIMCQRLSSTISGERVETGALEIAVVSQPGLVGNTLVASTLAALLHEITGRDVLLVSMLQVGQDEPLPGLNVHLENLAQGFEAVRRGLELPAHAVVELTVGFEAGGSAEKYGAQLSELVNHLGTDFKYKVFDMPGGLPEMAASAGDFVDVLVEIVEQAGPCFPTPDVRPGGPQTVRYPVLNLHNRRSRRIAISATLPFVIPDEPGFGPAAALANRRTPAALPMWRLARKILGRSVGLVLGGGAAFGLSHLGVLQVLEQNAVPIDLLVGCSIGSMVAVSYAAGFPLDEMIRRAHEMGRAGYVAGGLDFTLFRPGIIAGERLKSRFSPLLGDKQTFEDLLLPCRTVATDIRSGELVAIGSGRLEDAYRASIAVPLVIAPEVLDERVFVDGGVADPVPAETARQMGADVCIAVPVVPRLKKGVETVIQRWVTRVNAFNPLSYLGPGKDVPNALDITMNSLQTLQHELGLYKIISADVTIRPELSDFTWTDFDRSRELVERGVQAAEAALPALRKAMRRGDAS